MCREQLAPLRPPSHTIFLTPGPDKRANRTSSYQGSIRFRRAVSGVSVESTCWRSRAYSCDRHPTTLLLSSKSPASSDYVVRVDSACVGRISLGYPQVQLHNFL